MAVTFQSWAAAAFATTPISAAHPASLAAEDLIVLMHANKPFGSIPTQPAGWLFRGSGVSGAVANGLDTGSVRASVMSKESDGTESGTNLSVATTSGLPSVGRMARLTKAGGTLWSTDMRPLADTTETGTGVSASATGTASIMNVTTGDVLLFGVAIRGDAINHTSQGVTIAGCVLGAITWETKTAVTTDNDMGLYVGRCTVTSGTSTGNPVYTATSSLSGASSTAVIAFRAREIASLPSAVGPLTFDHGADEDDLTVANSDDGGDPAITGLSNSGGGVTPAYDTTDPIRGTTSIRCNVTGSNGVLSLRWGHQLEVNSDRTWIWRARVRVDGTITAGDRIMVVLGYDSSFQAEARMTATGAVELRNAGATVQDTSTTLYATGDIIDYAVTMIYSTTAGQILMDLIDPATGSSIEQLASAANQNTVQAGGAVLAQVGVCRSVANPLVTTVDDLIADYGTTIPTLPNIGGGTALTETVDDTVGLVDSAPVVSDHARTQTDAAGLVDVATPAAAHIRAQTDVAGLTDAATSAAAHNRTATDTTGLTDTATPVLTPAPITRTVDDDTGITDGGAPLTLDVSETVTDTAGLTDAIAAAVSKSLTDNAGLTDAASTVTAHARTQTDNVGLTDTASVVSAHARTQNDTAGITDSTSVSTAGAGTRTADDTVGLTDSIALTLEQSRTDTAGLTDTRAAEVGKGVTDALGLVDVTTLVAAWARPVTDTAGLVDSSTAVLDAVRTQSDSAGLTDSVQVSLLSVSAQVINDSIGLTSSHRAVLTTNRPSLGVTIRPVGSPARTARPYAGVTSRYPFVPD